MNTDKTARELAEELIKQITQLKCGYREILNLAKMLEEAEIPHILVQVMDGWHLCYPVREPLEKRVCSVIEHYGSYGHEQDLLEIMGLLTAEEEQHDSVAGWLSAEDVFARIKAHWEERR